MELQAGRARPERKQAEAESELGVDMSEGGAVPTNTLSQSAPSLSQDY